MVRYFNFRKIANVILLICILSTTFILQGSKVSASAKIVNISSLQQDIKITANGPRLIQISVNLDKGIGITASLCDANKRQISEKKITMTQNSKLKYYVEKGVYYIHVSTNKVNQKLQYEIIKKDSSGGSNRGSASSLRKGDNKKYGLLGVSRGIKERDYYKFTISSPQVVNIAITKLFSGNDSDILKIGIKKGVSETLGETQLFMNQKSGTITLPEGPGKLPAGTYYIIISKSPYAKNAGMMYSIRWK